MRSPTEPRHVWDGRPARCAAVCFAIACHERNKFAQAASVILANRDAVGRADRYRAELRARSTGRPAAITLSWCWPRAEIVLVWMVLRMARSLAHSRGWERTSNNGQRSVFNGQLKVASNSTDRAVLWPLISDLRPLIPDLCFKPVIESGVRQSGMPPESISPNSTTGRPRIRHRRRGKGSRFGEIFWNYFQNARKQPVFREVYSITEPDFRPKRAVL